MVILAVALFTLSLGFPPARAATGATGQPAKFVILIQNSGWMEPFYSDDRTEKFDRAVAAFVERAIPPASSVIIASFNKNGEIDGRPSPLVVYDGPASAENLRAAIARIDLPRRRDGKLANSDYKEALLATISGVVKAQPSVIFMITNNKSAPNGRERPEDGPVTERTKSFNDLLKSSSAIPRIIAWPLRYPVQGKLFGERGLVIYGIAYGDSASESLRSIGDSPAIRQIFTDPPVRLKPLTFDPLVLSLTPGRRGDLTWYASANGGVAIDGVSSGGDVISMTGALTNSHYPYVISQAVVRAYWTPRGGVPVSAQVQVKPTRISGLLPFDSVSNVSIDVTLSAVDRPDWLADRMSVPGTLSIKLTDLKLDLSPQYVHKMVELFHSGAAPTPDVPAGLPAEVPQIFINYKDVNQATTEVPMTFVVAFFPWPLIGAIAAGLLLVTALGAAFFLLSGERPYQIPIDGEPRVVALRRFQTKTVKGMANDYLVTKGLFGPPTAKPKTAAPS